MFRRYRHFILFGIALGVTVMAQELPIPLVSKVTRVQPMTGIVLWDDSEHVKTNAVQLEYSYVPYDLVAVGPKGEFDWRKLDRKLDEEIDGGCSECRRCSDLL